MKKGLGLAGVLMIVLAVSGCATDSGLSVCRAKSPKELAAAREAGIHESIADAYRMTNAPYQARYHEVQAQKERDKAAGESNLLADLIYAIFFNCNE